MKEFKYIRTIEKNDKTIGEILSKIVGGNKKLNNGLIDRSLKKIWAKRFGQSIVNYTEEIKFQGGILYIKLNSSALKQELSQSKNQILDILNTELGEEKIKKVVIY